MCTDYDIIYTRGTLKPFCLFPKKITDLQGEAHSTTGGSSNKRKALQGEYYNSDVVGLKVFSCDPVVN